MGKKTITEEIKKAIIDLKNNTDLGHREIAAQLGIGVASVSRIWNEDRDTKFNPSDPMVRSDAVRVIKKKRTFTPEFLASKLHTTAENANRVILHLAHHDGLNLIARGKEWQLTDTIPAAKTLDLKRLIGEDYWFGVVSDTHLANEHARLDVLELSLIHI